MCITVGMQNSAKSGFGKSRIFSWMIVANDPCSFSEISSVKKIQLFDCACHLWILVHFRQLPLETYCSVHCYGHAEICRIRIWKTQRIFSWMQVANEPCSFSDIGSIKKNIIWLCMAPLDTDALSPITSGNQLFCALLWACRNLQNQDLANPGFSPEC